jgi:hypothetical protein
MLWGYKRRRWGWDTAIRTSFSSCDVNGDQMKCFPRLSLFVFHNPPTLILLVHLYLLANLATSAFVQDADRLGYGGTSFQVTVQSFQTNTEPNIQLTYGRIKIFLCLITYLATQAYSSVSLTWRCRAVRYRLRSLCPRQRTPGNLPLPQRSG